VSNNIDIMSPVNPLHSSYQNIGVAAVKSPQACHIKLFLLWQQNVCREIGSLLNFVTYLVGWRTCAVSFPPSDVILAQLA